jgi:valyl-tRNA synthetase
MCSSDKSPISKNFDKNEAEGRIYARWESEKAFQADPERPGRPFCIVIPPPNVTGTLHMGHALDVTIQDMLVRYHRMLGDNTLWVPGTDHAGIATQAVVERFLAKEGVSRAELGRERFVERVWRWKDEYGGKITNQLRRLGASCDWSRERFTMDPGLSRAVREVFVGLYEAGLIYRGDYVINWCPRCGTAISDIEVEHEERDDKLYYIKYPGINGAPDLTVATTRPETMFGDTAVAVNPADPRFPQGEGLMVRVPLTDRAVPVIRDAYVDTEFGTGALKVTPAHDLNDFQIGRRHSLPIISAIDKKGILTEAAGAYQGLDRGEARLKTAADLEAQGLLVKTEPLRHAVGVCYRCRTVIEPILSLQWFVKCAPLAEGAKALVAEGQTKLVPDTWGRTFFEWMDNIRDWCVSRQLWWGHQIPAWHCQKCQKTVVSREDPAFCPDCGGELERDPDVLDTWFSSALWPFSTLGWPEDTPDLRRWYPTSVLVTGFDILFFWVARMMMMAVWATKKEPFSFVVLHPLVRDMSGRKMSKSFGNSIDPLEAIGEFGADPLRFALASQAGSARDLRLSKERIAGCGRFVNKLWNAARFVLSALSGSPDLAGAEDDRPPDLLGRWIRSRLSQCVKTVRAELDEFHFDRASDAVYHFLWDEFCDWHLELAKPVLSGSDPAAKLSAQRTLYFTLAQALKLLHPIMPFVTEELWGRLPGNAGLLMLEEFPKCDGGASDPEAERGLGVLMDVTRAVRQARADFRIPPGAKLAPVVRAGDPETAKLIESHRQLILRLMGAESLAILGPDAEKPKGTAESVLSWGAVWTPLGGQIDAAAEEAKLSREAARLEKDAAGFARKLENEGYLAKAPEEVVEETRERLRDAEARLEQMKMSLSVLRAMIGENG